MAMAYAAYWITVNNVSQFLTSTITLTVSSIDPMSSTVTVNCWPSTTSTDWSKNRTIWPDTKVNKDITRAQRKIHFDLIKPIFHSNLYTQTRYILIIIPFYNFCWFFKKFIFHIYFSMLRITVFPSWHFFKCIVDFTEFLSYSMAYFLDQHFQKTSQIVWWLQKKLSKQSAPIPWAQHSKTLSKQSL